MIARRTTYLMLTIGLLLFGSVGNRAVAQHSAHSVLRSGQWWKLEIRQTGVYRLDASQVGGLTGVAIANVALYGQEGGVLSEDNRDPRPDDLQEMPLDVHDANSNGIFDDGDWILFYGTAANKWAYNSQAQQIQHTPHPYSTANYLFLTAQSGTHKRIATTSADNASGAAITTCRTVALHDVDQVNTAETGQIWVGEKFYGGFSQRSITLTLPAVPTGTIKVRYGLASITKTSSSFSVNLNGTTRNHSFTSRVPYQVLNEQFPTAGSSTLTFNISYSYNESLAAGWLDFIEVDATTPLAMSGSMMTFYIPATGGVRSHTLANAGSNVAIWQVTHPTLVSAMRTTSSGNTLTFNAATDSLQSYIAFTPASCLAPASITAVGNQDIHGSDNPDMIIVTHRDFQAQAQRLASLHSIHDNYSVLTVTQEAVFNEFSSGQADPMAIREMLRMFWQRAQNDASLPTPRYLLLFGKGTFDNKDLLGNNLPTVITYQSPTSFDEENGSYATDDVFGYMENNEQGLTTESLDISIGRLPARDIEQAEHLVDKIERYLTRSDLMQNDIRGDWRNSIALLADDADPSCNNDTVFTNSQEKTAKQISQAYPQYFIDKIYADAYVQQSGADGSYYPDVNNALKKRMDYGCLLINYIGHGSAQYIGTERYMHVTDIDNYTNYHQQPFFVTSTCSFGRYDGVGEKCGSEAFVLAQGGGIGCVAASRPITHTQVINTDMVMQALNPANSIGDAVRIAKNNHTTPHAVTLMGDPAIKLSFPTYRVVITAINGSPVIEGLADSAMVLSTVEVEGEIRDANDQIVSDFDGIIYPEVYDRVVSAHTLANDNDNCEVAFTQQKNVLYKGRDSVFAGRFSYHFVVPRDVAYKYESCKMIHYAKSNTEDASGAYTNLFLGGFDETVDLSETRPEVQLYINDTNFLNGGITDQNPTLLAVVRDSIGINAVGSGLGHDMTAILDNNANDLTVLNDFYEPDIEDPTKGYIRYTFSNLSSGWHTITFKVWNIYNYSSTESIRFYVHNSDTATTAAFKAYPNPADNYVMLSVEHNCNGSLKSATFEIFDRMGRCMKHLTPNPEGNSFVVGPILWNLRADNGARVPSGVYMTRCTIVTESGEKLVENGKVVVK